MSDYYSNGLAGKRLKRCYDIASERVKQYLNAEIEEVRRHLSNDDSVIELGCGYGRVIKKIATDVRVVYGIDTSITSLMMAKDILKHNKNCPLLQMSATSLAFPDSMFDVTLCIQNGISAFAVDPRVLVEESLRVTRRGGLCIFSSYSDKFWEERLAWFQKQSEYGLLGAIDKTASKSGKIVCEDGFVATTFSERDFQDLSIAADIKSEIYEVDNSSIFCVIRKLS